MRMIKKNFRAGADPARINCIIVICLHDGRCRYNQERLDSELQRVVVSDITVILAVPKPNPQLQAILTEELRKAMPTCAKGDRAHRLKVTVTEFKEANAAKAVLIGDDIELKGRVEFTDATTGVNTGEYFVENSFFWGGLVGAAMMSDAERSLSEGYAQHICEKVFGAKPKE